MRIIFLCGLLLVASFCGCSTFERDWKRTPASAEANSMEGRWQGRWISEGDGHHGALRCLMVREKDLLYQAHFRATFARIFHFSYTAHLEAQPHDTGWEFNGEADLGKLAGGTYYYEGRATTTNLISTYRSKFDRGRFELYRVR